MPPVTETPQYDVALDSLQRRMNALYSIYDDAIETMNVEHVNHVEREGVLPIAFSLFHVAHLTDTVFEVMTGAPLLWNDRWAAEVSPAIADHGKDKTVAEMSLQQIGDFDAYKRYQRAVFARIQNWLGSVDPGLLARVVVERPLPAWFAKTFSARVAGPHGITLLDAAECWLYQHGLRHMGEIEHARALVGLQGMTS